MLIGTKAMAKKYGLKPRAKIISFADIGVDHDAVAAQLEREGVSSFQKSFDELLAALATKAAALRLS